MKHTKFIQFLILIGLFCLPAVFSTAQNAIEVPPPCGDVLASTQAELQKMANATCRSATRCVPCTEKKSGAVVYATLLAQPRCKAPEVPTKVQGPAQTERNPPQPNVAQAEPKPTLPVFEIVQQRCESGQGADLSVYIPGNTLQCGKGQYAFLWEIDGGKGGHADTVPCACGKIAQLTVTDIKTGLSQTKKLELIPCSKQ